MKIENPDVAAHVARCMQIDVDGIESDVKEIMSLMDAAGLFFHTLHDFPESDDWAPQSDQTKEIVRLLVAPENRPALRKWYKRHEGTEINPLAKRFQRILSRMTGEEL